MFLLESFITFSYFLSLLFRVFYRLFPSQCSDFFLYFILNTNDSESVPLHMILARWNPHITSSSTELLMHILYRHYIHTLHTQLMCKCTSRCIVCIEHKYCKFLHDAQCTLFNIELISFDSLSLPSNLRIPIWKSKTIITNNTCIYTHTCTHMHTYTALAL